VPDPARHPDVARPSQQDFPIPLTAAPASMGTLKKGAKLPEIGLSYLTPRAPEPPLGRPSAFPRLPGMGWRLGPAMLPGF
jgi:hypothetical protein